MPDVSQAWNTLTSPPPPPESPAGLGSRYRSLTMGFIGTLCLCALVFAGLRSSSMLLEVKRRLPGRVRRLGGRFKGGRSGGEEGVHLRDANS